MKSYFIRLLKLTAILGAGLFVSGCDDIDRALKETHTALRDRNYEKVATHLNERAFMRYVKNGELQYGELDQLRERLENFDFSVEKKSLKKEWFVGSIKWHLNKKVVEKYRMMGELFEVDLRGENGNLVQYWHVLLECKRVDIYESVSSNRISGMLDRNCWISRFEG